MGHHRMETLWVSHIISGIVSRPGGLALAVFRRHNQYIRHEPQMFQLLFTANAEQWDGVRDFKKFLLQKITEIIDAGSQSGEFHVPAVDVTARVLVDCLAQTQLRCLHFRR
jgi:Tetracyclin repressor-like, C-terminal domain